uniref:Uncharacterized protein n=1 Tax=Arundo donax TaxID=35708 RepID=A0A0A9GLB2_ARUDO
MNLLHQPQFLMSPSAQGQNFHFVGVPHNFAPTYPPPPPYSKGTPSPPPPSDKQDTSKASIEIDGDDGAEASRTTKTKRHWTHEEEVRLE